MFKTILIANRGEIACRIIATCRRLGVETVAVFSEADAGARHVRLADRAVAIGPSPAAESYLDGERIIAAALDTGAGAIHPGYGFLAENADFARAVADAGLVLIGPDAATIEAMGSKAKAKAIMESASVPLVPGYHGDDQDDEALAAEANGIGFPVMLKAAAGGGGKGMRIVRSAEEFAEALAAARREAQSAFGDKRMIIERYLETPRHIEAQVFGDRSGNIIHLFERDCSSQRRHQKVIEEAPAPGLDEEVRESLLEAAVRAAQAVDYVGAGTVEFLVDGEEFFFLEMNTRLQVEHPVTEMITGEDLVEWQLRIASGEPLPRRQDEIACTGHAMEARIYAEDPARGFLPGSGTVRALTLPQGPGIRADSGVEAGDTVSVYYDPMIAKLVVHDRDRQRCLARLEQALAASFAAGLPTNLAFLERLAAHPAFVAGTVDTGLLDRAIDEILDAGAEPPMAVFAAAACHWLAAHDAGVRESGADDPWAIADSWRPGGPAPRRPDLEIAGVRRVLDVHDTGPGRFRIGHEGHTMDASLMAAGDHHVLMLDGRARRIRIHDGGETLEIVHAGRRWRVRRHPRFEAVTSTAGGDGRVTAPMPGKVIQVRVTAGDRVEADQVVAIMEAMKMELSIRAGIAGAVAAVQAAEGDVVEADAALLEISPD